MKETIEMIEMKGNDGNDGNDGNERNDRNDRKERKCFLCGSQGVLFGVLLSPAYCRIRRSFPASSICGPESENLQFWKPSRSLKAQHTYLCR